MMEHIAPVNDSDLDYINTSLNDVHIAVSMSMAYIRKIQGWQFQQLEKRFTGLSISTWKRYLQPSYKKMRPLHVVAAYSWLTMVPMPSFYRGLNIKKAYTGMDDEAVEAMIHCGILPKRQFRLMLDHLYEYLLDQQKAQVDQFFAAIRDKYGSLDDYDNKEFMFPERLDMQLFAYDYYRSVALAFQEFRSVNQLSIDTMAHVLNLSPYRYEQCEDPENPISLPIDIAARLKLGFKLTDTMPFTAHMQHFPQFHTVRRIQHIRETKLAELMRCISATDKHNLVSIISNISAIVIRINHEKRKLKQVTQFLTVDK